MKLIELHILQSFPVTCLNRDDLGSPKSALFGGANRARISSQCLKRASRQRAAKLQPKLLAGKRSRRFIAEIISALSAEPYNLPPDRASALAKCAGHYLAKLDLKNEGSVKTLMFLSPLEYECLARVLAALNDEDQTTLVEAVAKVNPEDLEKDDQSDESDDEAGDEKPKSRGKGKNERLTGKQFTKIVAKVLKSPLRKEFKEARGLLKDAGDIAIFGRMVASDHSLTVEGASMFSHALSTHKVDGEVDFWTAVDDHPNPDQEAGAAGMGHAEFNSATYYRYAALNLDLLEEHLSSMDKAEIRSVVEAFVRGTIEAIPSARKNSMNGSVEVGYAVGFVREQGHPLQLINAFESPVISNGGILKKSAAKALIHLQRLKNYLGADSFARAFATGVSNPQDADFASCSQDLKELGCDLANEKASAENEKFLKSLKPEFVSLNSFCTRLLDAAFAK